jgi:hypothetical protein
MQVGPESMPVTGDSIWQFGRAVVGSSMQFSLVHSAAHPWYQCTLAGLVCEVILLLLQVTLDQVSLHRNLLHTKSVPGCVQRCVRYCAAHGDV